MFNTDTAHLNLPLVKYYIWPDGEFQLAEEYDQIEDCERYKSDDYETRSFECDDSVQEYIDRGFKTA